MRRKPWARPELASAPFFIDDPAQHRGNWRKDFARPDQPLWLELGCGKGISTALLAAARPEINLLAVDIKSDILGVAKRAAEAEFAHAGRVIDNLLLTAKDIERIDEIIAPEDKIDRLLIYFCNPWPKARGKKHRLTYPTLLRKYRDFLAPDATLIFKTDDDSLFEDTQQYLVDCGFVITEAMWELPDNHPQAAYQSEHERMFRQKGLSIHYLCARME